MIIHKGENPEETLPVENLKDEEVDIIGVRKIID